MKEFNLIFQVFVFEVAHAALSISFYAQAATVLLDVPTGHGYELQNVTVNVGDKVVWANDYFDPRDVESYTGEWKSPLLTNQGATFSFRFTEPGTFTYRSYAYSGDPLSPRSVMPGTITVVPWTNSPPAVTILHPVEGFYMPAPAFGTGPAFPIVASVTNNEANIVRIEFFAGTNILATVTNAPFRYYVDNIVEGRQTLTARVTDNQGLVATSRPVNIIVVPFGGDLLHRPRRLPNGVFICDWTARTYIRNCLSIADDLAVGFGSAFLLTSPYGTYVDETATNVLHRFYSFNRCP